MSKSWISVTRARSSGVKPCNLPFEFPPAQRLRQPKVPRWQQWRKQSSSTALTSVTKELFLLDEVLFYVHMEYGGVDTRSFIDRTENGRLLHRFYLGLPALGLAPIRAGLLSKSSRNARFSGLEPVRLRNSSTSVSVVRPPDERFGSCLTKERPEAVSQISCQRSPFELR